MLGDYNYVDGFSLGQKLEISGKLNSANRLTFIPEAYYATARKQLIWQAGLRLDYAPMRLGSLSIFAGDVSADFNPLGIDRFDDASSILLWGKNNRMLYRRKYVQIRNAIDQVS